MARIETKDAANGRILINKVFDEWLQSGAIEAISKVSPLWPRRKSVERIETRDANGKYNGWVRPLWHVDHGPEISQVYITAVAPGCVKGPHLHKIRRGCFYLISGTGALVVRTIDLGIGKTAIRINGTGQENKVESRPPYAVFYEPNGVQVMHGVPCALYNTGSVDAVFLNMPSPPWRESEPDEHDVPDWNFKL